MIAVWLLVGWVATDGVFRVGRGVMTGGRGGGADAIVGLGTLALAGAASLQAAHLVSVNEVRAALHHAQATTGAEP